MKYIFNGSLLLCAVTSTAAATPLLNDVYLIGNSLTWDMEPKTMDDSAAGVGFDDAQTGYHIWCARGPSIIFQHPEETCITPTPSTWDTALPSQAWDGIGIQLYPGPKDVETLGLQSDAIVNMYGAATSSQNPELLIYMPPPRLNWSLAELWEEQTLDVDDQRFRHSEKYFRDLIDRVETALPETKVWGIPGPQIQLELLASGLVQDRAELYRDEAHSSDAGRWIGRTAHMEIRFGPQNWPAFKSLDADWLADTTVLIRQQVQAFNVPEPSSITSLSILLSLLASRWKPARL